MRILSKAWANSAACFVLLGYALLSSQLNAAGEKVLFVGNSFTAGSGIDSVVQAGGIPGLFEDLAIAGGQDAPEVTAVISVGKDFGYHLADSSGAVTAINSDDWDYVVLQELSTGPTHVGSVEDFETNGTALNNLIKTNNASTETVFFQTWARERSHALYKGVNAQFPGGPAEMMAELRENIGDLADTLSATVAPVGDSFEKVLELLPYTDLYATDEYHANANGCYLAACVYYALIYDDDPRGLPALAGVTDGEAAIFQAIAWSVVKDLPLELPAHPHPAAQMEIFSNLKLVDEINCGDPQDPHDFFEYPIDTSEVDVVLNRDVRLIPNDSDLPKYFAYRIGEARGLVAGRAYVLEIDFPDDIDRSMVVLNHGGELVRGIYTGKSTGDGVTQLYTPSSRAESLEVPHTGEFQTYQMLFHLHDRFPDFKTPLNPGEYPRDQLPEDGFWVIIAQFGNSRDPLSNGAAVSSIRLYEAPTFNTYAQDINFPPTELPRRYLFNREEIGDNVVRSTDTDERGVADPTDWFEYKAMRMRYYGMNVFAKDLLEFGRNQGFDTTVGGGNDWYAAHAFPDRWANILSMLQNYDLDILPYYEYAGGNGHTGISTNPTYHPKPLTGFDYYTPTQWVEDNSVDILHPEVLADVELLLDATIAPYTGSNRILGAWFRSRRQTPISFSDYDMALYSTENAISPAIARTDIQEWEKIDGTWTIIHEDEPLYDDYKEWWFDKRADFLNDISTYLRSDLGVSDAVLLYTSDASEFGRGIPTYQSEIVTDDVATWEALASVSNVIDYDYAVANELHAAGLVEPRAHFGTAEWHHSDPENDPANYTANDYISLTYSYSRGHMAENDAGLELFRTGNGLAMVRHHNLNEKLMTAPDEEELLGYFVADMERTGPYIMMAEALAMASGDPRYIGYLTATSYTSGSPGYVRAFNRAFLALPALPSEVETGAASNSNVVVRSIDTTGYGTYLSVVNTSFDDVTAVTIDLPATGSVIDAATGELLVANDNEITLDLYAFELRALRLSELPSATNDTGVTVDEFETVIIDVLANDTDPDGGPEALSIISLTQPTHGFVEVISGEIHYTPHAGYSGADSFTYTISDGQGQSTATVNLTVSDTTSASNLASAGLSGTNLGTSSGASRIFGDDDYWALSGDGVGLGGSSDNVRWEYDTQSGDFQAKVRVRGLHSDAGSPTAGIMLRDGSSAGARMVSLGIAEGDAEHEWFARTSASSGASTDSSGQAFALPDTWLMIERDGDDISIAVSSDDSVYSKVGEFTLSSLSSSVRIGLYATSGTTPEDGVAVFSDFTITSLGSGVSLNLPPVAVSDSPSVDENQSTDINVLSNDSDPDSGPSSLTLSSVTQPANGSVEIISNQARYTPNAGYYGSDNFSYTVSDGAAVAVGSVSVTVNDTSTASDLTSAGLAGGTLGGSNGGASRILATSDWEIVGAGVGAAGATDSLYYESDTVTGDFQATVQLKALTGPLTANSVAGIMLREGPFANDRMALVGLNGNGNLLYSLRQSAGISAAEYTTDNAVTLPDCWLQIERKGDVVKFAFSEDGDDYFVLSTKTIVGMPEDIELGLFVASGSDTQSIRAVFDDYAVTAPSPFLDLDIGSVVIPGNSTYNPTDGSFVVTASGDNIWGRNDGFHFAYTEIEGDGEVILRVNSLDYNGGTVPKLGIMLRETLNDDSPLAYAFTSNNVAGFHRRKEQAQEMVPNQVSNSSYPCWIRLQRSGNSITMSRAPDVSGAPGTWVNIPSSGADTVVMPSRVYLGIAMCGMDNGRLATGYVDNFSYTFSDANRAPVAVTDFHLVDEGTVLTVDVVANDYDPDTGPSALTLIDVDNASHGIVSVVSGEARYEPLPGFYGEDSFTYTVSDGEDVDTGTVYVTVNDTSIVQTLLEQGLTKEWIGPDATGGARLLENFDWEVNGSATGMGGVLDSTYFERGWISGDFRVEVQMKDISGNGVQPRAGLMVREGVSPYGKFAYVGGANSDHFLYASREAAGASATITEAANTFTFPNAWLAIERSGDSLTLEVSTNGSSYTTVDTIDVTDWSPSLELGLFSESGSIGVFTRAVFKDYTITLPASLSDIDIDTTGTPVGFAGYSDTSTPGQVTVHGSGTNVWYGADVFHYTYAPMSGDIDFSARISGNDPGFSIKAGLMIRDSVSNDAKNVFAFISGSPKAYMTRRTTTGGSTANSSATLGGSPYYIRVTRDTSTSSDTFRTYHSTDGSSWSQIGSDLTFDMSSEVLVGFAVCAQNNSILAHADFTDISGLNVGGGGSGGNLPPSAVDDFVVTNESTAITIDALLNDDDPDGSPSPLSLSSVTSPTPNGTASIVSGKIVYTPNPGFFGIDTVTYTNTDGDTSDTGMIRVQVNDTSSAHDLVAANFSGGAIGSNSSGGSRTLANGELEIYGSGDGVGSTADSLYYESQEVSGDFHAVVNLREIYSDGSALLAGLMLRESTTAGSRYVMIGGPDQSDNYDYGWRTTTSGSASGSSATETYTVPNAWLSLKRVGDVVTLYASDDDETYVEIDDVTLSSLAATLEIGLFATSDSSGTTTVAQFDAFRVNQVFDFTETQIGSGLTGSWTPNTFHGEHVVEGSGSQVWASSDRFHFVHLPMTGDVEITARVSNISAPSSTPKAGIMIRNGTTTNDYHAFAMVNGTKVNISRRDGSGSANDWDYPHVTTPDNPYWVRLSRVGDVFTAYHSATGDEHDWELIDDPLTISMSTTVQVGLAVCAQDASNLATATFDFVRIGGVSNRPPVAVDDNDTITEDETATVAVLSNDSDPDSGPSGLSLVSVTQPANGYAYVSGSNVIYEPAVGFYGVDTLTYVVSDGASTAVGTLTITVTDTASAHNFMGFGLIHDFVGPWGYGSSRVMSDGDWEINGVGTVMAGVSDSGFMEQVFVTGDFQMWMQLKTLTGGSDARGGLMMREDTTNGSRMAFVGGSASGGNYIYASRTIADNPLSITTTSTSYTFPDAWVLVERDGNDILLAQSADDTTYTELNTITFNSLADTLILGIYLTSGSTGADARMEVDDFQVVADTDVVVAINCGGRDGFTVGVDGTVYYEEDAPQYYTGGSRFEFDDDLEITATDDDPIYRSFRFNAHSYAIDLPNDDYEVTLKFADNAAAGARQFNIAIEGTTVENDYDIHATAGGKHKAVDETYSVTVSDGVLNIDLTNGSVDVPKISGIVVKLAP
ncbi:Ig-like domain-containing protein [Cerasicoccus frondis]|uniref:Ig-like domain-containing protein n=1 Tax=Cerasicoccus frondis TaxID=490090 RepID=UPI002852B82E|nr:Ig-like domain-containing protein [Cerasicoccus frondis]